MSFPDANEKYGKVFLIASSLVVGLVILLLFRFYGYDATWELWRVPVEHPQFSDFRLIPGSAESYREGIEPTQRNPGDPHKRIFNYPAFWRLFFYTGITQNDTVWMVLVMLALFFAGVFLFPHDITILDSMVILLVIFSPASMLLYERGNVDLIVLFLCAMIVLSTDLSPFITSALLIFATIVKLYPFFGVTVLLKESKSKFVQLFLSCLGILLAYLYVTSKSVRASWDLTMRGDQISYGANVFFLRYGQYFSNLLGVSSTAPLLKYGPIILAFAFAIAAGLIGLARRESLTFSSSRNVAAFRMGASIYVGTFLLGSNWDYRLAFLILAVPQILQWSRHTNKHYSFTAGAVLALVLISCWHFVVWFAPSLANVKELLFVVDEIVNWMLVAGFSCLLAASGPDWVREQFSFLFPRKTPAEAI
jgi:hypothetical protein